MTGGTIYTLSEINAVAHTLIVDYGHPSGDGATILALKGDLGAGKTTLVQAIAWEFGITESVTSPTFILEKVYELEGQNFERFIHIDAYRFEKPEELLVLGWDDLIKNPQHLILLEWPERVAPLLPPQTQILELTIVDENTRRIYAKNA